MNLKTAVVGSMLTAGTVLGGCARKAPETAENLYKKVNMELLLKNLQDSTLNATDSVFLNACKEVQKAEAAKSVAEAKREYALANLAFKKDSMDFVNKSNKNSIDTLALSLRDSQRAIAKSNVNLTELLKSLIEHK